MDSLCTHTHTHGSFFNSNVCDMKKKGITHTHTHTLIAHDYFHLTLVHTFESPTRTPKPSMSAEKTTLLSIDKEKVELTGHTRVP